MQKLLVVFLFVLSLMTGWANNIKINSEAKIVGFTGAAQDTALVEFSVTWDNSWRDDFNWDAAWIFLKYKKRGLNTEWQHAYLTREGHTAQPQTGNEGGNYMFMFGEIGTGNDAKVTGVYLIRDGIADGQVNATVQVKWPIAANTRMPLTVSDFGADRDSVYVAAYAIEMVYVPYGSFMAGDDFSFSSFSFKGIPENADVINLNSGYEITASSTHQNYYPANAANHLDDSKYSTTTSWEAYNNPPYWWQIDFKGEKTIRYFGVSGSTNYPALAPQGTWYLQGSKDGVNFENLVGVSEKEWLAVEVSYPVQCRFKVTNPKPFRYYRINFPQVHNDLVVQNIAMTEKDLGALGEGWSVEGEGTLAFMHKGVRLDLPASYPKGYRGFYAMKYEVSQEQYVEFLNSLTLTQQKNRVMNSDFEHMSKGDYVFGDVKRPNCRNGIAFLMQKGEGAPALFGNNLNADNKFYSEDDGQTLACNYLSPADMLAYCDWSGLRPMSELEYEKSCRRPSPQIPEKGEYAWNSNSGVNRLRTLSDLTGAQTERETPFDYKINVNAGNRVNGPVRNGSFATGRTSQLEAGATYWGLMEMSGNLWELCYNATASGAVFKGDDGSYSHGDGALNTDGSTDIGASYWPSSVAAFGVRGGSFVSADSLLRTSDRTYAGGNYFSALTQRDSSVGFRGVRSVLNTTGFTAGRIYCGNGLEQDTVCSGEEFTITGEPAENTIGKTTYVWYVSEDKGTSWVMVEGTTGNDLNFAGFVNNMDGLKELQFKRKAICSIGEETTTEVQVQVSPAVTDIPCIRPYYNVILGGNVVLRPAGNLSENLKQNWNSPLGTGYEGEAWELTNLSSSDLGRYLVYYVDSYGCKGEIASTELRQASRITIVQHADGYRMWSDGTFAASAEEYRHCQPPYYYEGNTGDGIYRIQSDYCNGGTPQDVYCDMTTDGGGWTLVWKAAHNNYNTTAYSYDVGDLSTWYFKEVAMAYLNPADYTYTNFVIMKGEDMIKAFQEQHPLSHGGKDVIVDAKYGDDQQSGVIFKFGKQNFPRYIYEGWYEASSSYGRIGLDWNKETPYYSGFNSSAGDFCVLGHQVYSGQSCSDTRRFSLWVR